MSSSRQGARSSRAGLISKSTRRRMQRLDRAISKLDWSIGINQFLDPPLAAKQLAVRNRKDQQRKTLRYEMKTAGRVT